MIAVTARQVVEATGGRLLAGNEAAGIAEISTDTREIRPGALFVPFRGEKFDGHAFIGAALDKGAGGFLVERGRALAPPAGSSDAIIIEVQDTAAAYARIAGLVRKLSEAAVVGITGSTGKTSTKDLLFALTGSGPSTVASAANNNNEVGVPLTLLSAGSETRTIIVEMGMRGRGQIAELAKYARPDIGVITNIGLTHVELLGSQAEIASAKSELAAALPPDGHLVLNHDDPWTPFLRERTKASVTTFGLTSDADYTVADLGFDEGGRSTWRLLINGKPGPKMRLSIPGLHNVVNSLAAIAAALRLGIPTADLANRLAEAKLTKMRLNVVKNQRGITVVDDTYNANPASMTAALDTLVRIRPEARHIAVLGKMAELGAISDREHRRLGVKAAGMSLDVLVGIGEEAALIIDAATTAGLPPAAARHFASNDEAVKWLNAQLGAGDVVLVKGSRAAGLEEVVAGLAGES